MNSSGILDRIKKIPAGTLIVPIFVMATVNTFFPQILEIGGYTQALFSKTASNTILAMIMLFNGIQLSPKKLIKSLAQGGTYVLVKTITGVSFYFLVRHYFGLGGFLGVCSLAILCGITNSNGSLYTGLTIEYGNETDVSARTVFSINSGPTLTILILGTFGNNDINIMTYVSMLIPLFVGMFLGILDNKIREATKDAQSLLIPLMGVVIGASIDLTQVIKSGITGLVLYLMVCVVTGPALLLVDRLILKKQGYASMSTLSVAGNAIAVPAVIGQLVPEFAPWVAMATVQLSGAVVFSVLITPFLVNFVAEKFGCPKYDRKSEKDIEETE